MQVFLSYSTEDLSRTIEIRDYLESNNISCWIAKRNIPAGADYAVEIPKAIDRCDIFLMILTPHSQGSQYVRSELEWAIKKRKKIIPYMPYDFQLNLPIDFHLPYYQRINVYEDGEEEAKRKLICRIHEINEPAQFNVEDNKQKTEPAIPAVTPLVKQVEPAEGSAVDNRSPYAGSTLSEMADIARNDLLEDVLSGTEIIEKAALDDPYSQYTLGKKYYLGKGISKDRKKAIYWLRKSVAHDNPDAMYLLGRCYDRFFSENTELAWAAYWYERSASHRKRPRQAVFAIANCYTDGKGVSKDILKQAYWCREAMNFENALTATEFHSVRYTRQYLQMLSSATPIEREILHENGYFESDVSPEVCKIVEQLHRTQKRDNHQKTTQYILLCVLIIVMAISLSYVQNAARDETDLLSSPNYLIFPSAGLATGVLSSLIFAAETRKNKSKHRILLISFYLLVSSGLFTQVLLVVYRMETLSIPSLLFILLVLLAILIVVLICALYKIITSWKPLEPLE